MPEVKEASVRTLDPAQATELSLLVDLEARWENLRKTPLCISPQGRGEIQREAERTAFEMAKPAPQAVDSAQLVNLARAVIQADRFPYLATLDGDQPRVRPVSPVKTDGFTVYVANLRSYHKTVEIDANPKVELCYLDDGHDQVRITGIAEIVADAALLQEIWDGNPLLRQYLGSINNPELILYRIKPTRVRFMKEWALNYYEVPI